MKKNGISIKIYSVAKKVREQTDNATSDLISNHLRLNKNWIYFTVCVMALESVNDNPYLS